MTKAFRKIFKYKRVAKKLPTNLLNNSPLTIQKIISSRPLTFIYLFCVYL